MAPPIRELEKPIVSRERARSPVNPLDRGERLHRNADGKLRAVLRRQR